MLYYTSIHKDGWRPTSGNADAIRFVLISGSTYWGILSPRLKHTNTIQHDFEFC